MDEEGWSTADWNLKPRCDDNGDYEPKQCDQITGECWCVTQCGNEINQTRGPDEFVKCSKCTNMS